MFNGREFDRPGTYHIRAKGNLDTAWSDWFDGFTIEAAGENETVLTGVVADQAALYGVLSKLRDLGLPLLLVERVEPASSALEEQPTMHSA